MKLKSNIFFCFIVSIAFAQSPGDLPPNAQAGKCYAKCLIVETELNEYTEELPVYIGDKYDETVEREWKELIVDNDERDTIMVEIVVDESSTIDFEYRSFVLIEYIEIGTRYTEWKEVLCENKVTDNTISDIQNALIDRGYLLPKFRVDSQFGYETKNALKKYQRENQLPIGNLDLVTLDALGIYY